MENFYRHFGTLRAHIAAAHKRILTGMLGLPFAFRGLFVFAFIVFCMSSVAILLKWNDRFLVEVPQQGGTLTEGIIGRPRFINPVIAKSDADRDMTALIYSGLLRATPEGTLIPDLAASYNVSSDGLTYTFTLKEGLLWHDGEAITSADVAFTIEKVGDSGLAIKSPRRASWEGVTIETPDATTIIFTIKHPYAPFLENATMGIIPKHIWQNVPDEEFDVSYHNIQPIGSGPYRIDKIVRDEKNGLPSYYDLVAFKHFALGEPYITNLRMMFFGNTQELNQAYDEKMVNQMHTIAPEAAQAIEMTGATILRSPLPRIFAVYFNQNEQPIFADKSVRSALNLSVDKNRIIREVLNGYGRAINGPLPHIDTSINVVATDEAVVLAHEAEMAKARSELEAAGWTLNAEQQYEKVDKKKKTLTPLQFSVAIPDVPELRKAALLMKHDWETLGASVTLKIFDPSTFATDVLAPRKYDALFYGQIIGRVPDFYPYWHSSQRNAPGLNVALYANKTVDKLLEDARKENDETTREAILEKFVIEIQKDNPAVFLYSPDFLYAISPRVENIQNGLLTTESERFLDIFHWYVESERIWKWFVTSPESI